MNRDFKYLFMLFVIFIAACIETDIYLPAFPDMMIYFNVSDETIQSLLTWNFLGMCLSGPFYGPISDAIGRKKPLLAALSLFLLGSLITVFAHNFYFMLFGRLLQGLGSGGCFTLGTAIIFDAFQAEKAISALNKLNLTIPFFMSGAPLLGGFLNTAFGFRSNFLAIAFFVLVSFLLCLYLFDETLPTDKRAPLKLSKVSRDFKTAFTSAPFWLMVLVVSLPFCSYILFLAGSAVLFVLDLGVSKEWFPLFQAALLLAWLVASLVSPAAIRKWGTYRVRHMGTVMIVFGALMLIASTLLTPWDPYSPTIAMVIYTFGANWCQGIYFPEGMEIHPEIKGVTASLLTSARLLLTAVVVGVTSAFFNGTIYPITIAITAVTVISTTCVILYERGAKQRKIEEANPIT